MAYPGEDVPCVNVSKGHALASEFIPNQGVVAIGENIVSWRQIEKPQSAPVATRPEGNRAGGEDAPLADRTA